MLLRSYQGKTPRLGKPRFIAPNATIVGDVTLGAGSSVWYGAVIRSDLNPIRFGRQQHRRRGGGALRHGGAPQQPGGRCARQDPAAG